MPGCGRPVACIPELSTKGCVILQYNTDFLLPGLLMHYIRKGFLWSLELFLNTESNCFTELCVDIGLTAKFADFHVS